MLKIKSKIVRCKKTTEYAVPENNLYGLTGLYNFTNCRKCKIKSAVNMDGITFCLKCGGCVDNI